MRLLNKDILIPILLILLLATTASAASSHKRGDRIDEEEAEKFFVEQAGCADSDRSYLVVSTMKHVNLTRDGRDNLLVVASTCMTGTAGPDVHSVLSRDDNGVLVELPIEEAKMPEHQVLFGNRNSDEDVDGDDLVSTYQDTSGREAPLVIRYRWDGKEFRQVSMVAAKPFPASFNCEDADEEVEQAICANEDVARLDRELNTAYLQKLRSIPPDQTRAFREQQLAWIAMRNKQCGGIYKDWVECLTDMYTKRIAELK